MSGIRYTITEAAQLLGIDPRRLRRRLKRPEYNGRIEMIPTLTAFGVQPLMTIFDDLLEELQQSYAREAKPKPPQRAETPSPAVKEHAKSYLSHRSEMAKFEGMLFASTPLAVGILSRILTRATAEADRVRDTAIEMYAGKNQDCRLFLLAVAQSLRATACPPTDEELDNYLDSLDNTA